MRILYLSQFFTAPSQPGISRSWMIAKFLGSIGYQVDVVASRIDYMTGQNMARKNEDSFKEPDLPEGVSVRWINTIFNGKSKIKRLLQYIIYCLFTLYYGLKNKKPDMVIATSPPIFVGLIGCWLAKLRGVKFIFEIRDPWPDALLYFGVLKKSLLTKLLYRMEKYLYQNAHLLVALSPGIKKLIENKGVPKDKIIVVTNGYDDELFEIDGNLIYPRKKQVQKETKVIYVGAMGKINETEFLMEVVTALKEYKDITFHFIGEGICKKDMVKTALERELNNVYFDPPVPKEKVPEIMASGDIAILTTKAGLYTEIGLHNKVFDYLGVGLPVVGTGGGNLKELIEIAGAGYIVEPDDISAMVEKIKFLHLNKDLAWQMGAKGREHILKYYRRDIILSDYETIIKKLISKKKEELGG